MKVFVFDAQKCNGCYSCQIACKDEHCNNSWIPYALPQPTTGQYWMRVDEQEHGAIPKVRVEYTCVPCMHCDAAPCIKAAAAAGVADAVYKRADGIVIINPEAARGMRELVTACPYRAIYYNEELDLPQKCTGCAHLLDVGELPHCVDLCATGGLRFGEEEDFLAEIAQAETLMPECDTKPRVYYLNRPHLFIAGEVWDPYSNDIVEGALVTLTDAQGKKQIVSSDDFGDFWFNQLLAGSYELEIMAKGFVPVKRTIELAESLNLGDFPLQRKD
ncbi:MAG: carboxypeptidase regulatory-like domain-containing protein [Coriobacteriales bacterium]|jgi:Fe-S-cluster-containing dehydrogenase component|nr:carboxypeptidase regulatory-like domain-containing protein [Coriobacteriales bacterium]